MTLVKLCLTCGVENPPTAARCACGAFLIGVDLTEQIPQLDAGTPQAPLPARERGGGVREEGAAHAPPGFDSGPVRGEADAAVDTPTLHTGDRTPANPVCAFSDCGQPNPAGASLCVYCNRPLSTSEASDTAAAAAPAAKPTPPPRPANERRSLIRLPDALAARFEIDEAMKAAGAEADLFIVHDRTRAEQAVLKLYRHGIEPNTEVLERVSRAAPDQLVRLIEHGCEDGVPYELLEYCPHGSLRALLKGRPLPLAAARTLLTELAGAIAHLHDCGIVHRDLKPENVLVRGLLPLDLVLTDFGISSITQATMHYTSAARTLRYSAPEAGSNWVGKPTDYWALGMILVEALSGRHPFEELSETVMAHWLVTRPIDVSGVADARWQQLCRGLLVRDPQRRWGAEEIARWLGGDDSLAVVDEREAPDVGAVSPYRVADQECRTPRELAVALAAHWPLAVKDLKRGMLRAWLQNDLRDQNLARAAADAEEALELSDDERLLRLLLRLDPALPPVFKGYDISPPGLAALTRKALEDHNEARQTVFEILERRILSLYPGSTLHELHLTFDQARGEFEQALERGFDAGASRELAPQGREWQLRMLLFVLEPPKGLLENLRASARRVGGRAAQRCAWYRALGDADTATPATLAAMVLLGPPAAQEGMELERESARRALAALSMTIDAEARLLAQHGEARERLTAAIEASHDEEEVLAFSTRSAELAAALQASIEALWNSDVFDGRPIADPQRLHALRGRIGEWARWRAGDAWASFGERIDLVQVIERRGYRLQLASQIETRRVPYKYSASDMARMPPMARAVLDDVWACEMTALPQFGADLKLARPQEIRCRRCNAVGRAELQESWGSTAYPFASTFACHDKVGVQCQTRLGWANEHLPMAQVPAFVADFVAAHAREEDSPSRRIELLAPAIPPAWIERMPSGELKEECSAKLAVAAADIKRGERLGAQRLQIGWNGLAEVQYRYEGKAYTIWIPDRADALPIALEHPLPSSADAAMRAAPSEPAMMEPPTDDAAAAATDPPAAAAGVRQLPRGAAGTPRWLRLAMIWGAIFIALFCVATWVVNWSP